MAEAIIAIKDVYLKNRSLFLFISKILVAAVLLLFIIYSVNINESLRVFRDTDKLFILAAFLLSFINIYLQFLKWELVCARCLGERDKKKIINSLFYGFTAGSFTPARIGEYVGRAVPFTEIPLLKVSSAVFIDKLFSFLIVFLTGTVSFLFFMKAGILLALIIVLILVLLAYSLLGGEVLTRPFWKMNNSKKWSKDLFSGIATLKTSGSELILKLTILSLLFYMCFIIQFALLVIAFSHQSDFMNYLYSGNLVMFAKTIIPPVSFGELGIREGASVYFLKQVGVSAAAGFNAAIFLFFINVLLPAITGLIFLLKRK